MPDPTSLRDSTQIVLHQDVLDEFKSALKEKFVLSFVGEDEYYRIIGSPVEIKAATKFLARNGVSLQ